MSELKLEAKEGIDQQTINSVKSLGESYKYGFTTDTVSYTHLTLPTICSV